MSSASALTETRVPGNDTAVNNLKLNEIGILHQALGRLGRDLDRLAVFGGAPTQPAGVERESIDQRPLRASGRGPVLGLDPGEKQRLADARISKAAGVTRKEV